MKVKLIISTVLMLLVLTIFGTTIHFVKQDALKNGILCSIRLQIIESKVNYEIMSEEDKDCYDISRDMFQKIMRRKK